MEAAENSITSDNVIKRKGRILLTDKSTRPVKTDRTLDKIPEKSFKKSTKGVTPKESEDETLKKLKAMNLSEDELAFLKEYRRLEELERQKGIKFFECTGDPPHTEEFTDGVVSKRENFINTRLEDMRGKDCTRYSSEVNSDKVVVPIEISLTDKPKWDVFENNHFAMRKRLVVIFLKVANKLIIRMRAAKRLQKLKDRFQELGVTNREECKKMVAEDWKASQNIRVEDDGD